MSRMFHAPLRLAAICALWLSLINQALAYQGVVPADDPAVKKPIRAQQPSKTSHSDEDGLDPVGGDDRTAAPNSPRPVTRAVAQPKTAKQARRKTPGNAAAVARAQNASRAADDDSSNNDDSRASVSSQPASRLNRPRDPRTPQRQTTISHATIDRAEAAGGQSHGTRAMYLQSQIDDDDSDETAESPGRSLEEQVAELKARLDALTDLQGAVPGSAFGSAAMSLPSADGSAGGGSPSTVQGSVFGPDGAAAGTFAVDNLTFISKDGNFKAHIGGVVQLDAIGFANTPSAIGIPGGAGINESVEFRRLRVRAEGTMYENIDWVSEIDLALALQNTDQLNGATPVTGLRSFPVGVGVQGGNTAGVIQPTTVFMTIKDVPVLGNVRIGSQQDWFSLEHIESARFLDFMERSTIMDAFSGPNNNGYTPGISAFNNTPDKRAGAQIGIYKNNVYDSGFTYSIGDAWTYGGRLIWTPYYDEESKGRYLLHTGIGSEWRTFNTNVSATTGFDNVRVRSRGLLRNAASTLDPNFADTGNFYAVSQTLVDPEIALQWGPWLFQSEYTASWFNGARAAYNLPASGLGSVFMEGGYAEALYFLTGENRDYNRQSGVFGRVVPNCNFNRAKSTWGAWQVGARFDWLDLNGGKANLVNGGNAQDMTLALNWFLNPSTRFQFNYVCSWINNAAPVTFPGTLGALNGARFTGDGPINSFGARMDFNF